MQTQSLQPYIDRLTCHSVLFEEEQEAILSLPIRVARVEANKDLVRYCDVTPHPMMILTGMLGKFEETGSGNRETTALYVPGDMAGLQTVLFSKAKLALQSQTASTILQISPDALRAATNRYPGIAEALWRETMVQADISSQWVMNISRRDGLTRMAHFICEMAIRLNADLSAEHVIFRLNLTQPQFADIVGLTPVHVNRMLRELRLANLVTFFQRQMVILDWNGLVGRGEFNSDYLHAGLAPRDRVRINQPPCPYAGADASAERVSYMGETAARFQSS